MEQTKLKRTMEKKTVRKAKQTATTANDSKPGTRTYPVEPQALERQQQRLKKAASAGAKALGSSPKSLPAATAVAQPEAVSQGTAPAVASPMIPVTFTLPGFAARDVALSGDFNDWSPSATPMTRDHGGLWEATVNLPPGRYQYKFIVDGEWIPDPLAQEQVANNHGTLNSVVEVSA